ncbi:anti-sigma regulatory factor [Kovacikia minuta CCNUW1]|uniref:ATP-binding protein n=1 Tax=Kovacikia minuta TaxID=2931930 RepID=UPI001CCDC20D|nr:anti-sigma regulatory factor [Kovacikia minuta]UBF26726.1 anti-sigma regulatory factor [Kovacikia minuta CCNUW1]
MIAVSSRPVRRHWNTISFASTLYLIPILDLLLAEIPPGWRAEVRLGLQEALVNAAKHGNNLDPSKTVLVRFSSVANHYWWIISDQGGGFRPSHDCEIGQSRQLPCDERECGRGMYILHQIFDQVQWNSQGTELRLSKRVRDVSRQPLVV